MQSVRRHLADRFVFLFTATKGLVLVAIALISLTTAFMGTLSGPMQTWGVTDTVVEAFGLSLVPAEREGRIILLYHTIAMAVIAIEVGPYVGPVARARPASTAEQVAYWIAPPERMSMVRQKRRW